MEKNDSEIRIRKGTGPLGVCPYLGVQDDPATHFAWAKPGHFCYRVRPPQAINVSHQENSCMNGRYPTCQVYPASFKGPLPSEIRDDNYTDWGTRAAVIKTSITNIGTSQRDTIPVEKSTARFGVDLSALRDQADFVEEEEVAATPWWSSRRGKVILIALIVLPILLLSTWAIIYTTRASENSPPTEPVPQTADLTATWQAALALLPSATASPTELPSPTPEPTSTPSPTATEIPATASPTAEVLPSDTPGPSPTSTVTVPALTCEDIEAYTVEMVDGPILTPEPGYVYGTGKPLPPIRSTWVIRNTGGCTWDEILLISRTSQRLLSPFLRVNGQLIIPYTNAEYSIAPGEQVEILLGFTTSVARSIRSDWGLVINGFNLDSQPLLSLDVHNWVINGQPTSNTPIDDGSPSKPPDPEPPSTRP